MKNSKYINDINPMAPMESSDCSKVFDFLHNLNIYLPNDLTIDNKKRYTMEVTWPDTTMSTQITGDIAKVDLEAILKNNPYIKEHEDYKNALNVENGKWYLGYVDKEISADITAIPLSKVRLFYGKKSDFNTNIFTSELPNGKVKILLTANIF